MKRNLILMLACLAATGLIAAGCGDDDDDGGDALTKEEFVTQGNKICTDGNAEIEAEAEEVFASGQPTPEEELAFAEDSVVPNIQSQIDGLRDLTPPEEDEETVTEMLDAAQAALDRAEADPSLLTSAGGEDVFVDVNVQLNDYGLTECGSSS